MSGVLVADDQPAIRRNAAVLLRAAGLASAGNYLGAIRALGDVKVELDEVPQDGIRPDDVEQALGDLGRALSKAPSGAERNAGAALLEAARVEAAEGRWAAAWELVDEADTRLASAYEL